MTEVSPLTQLQLYAPDFARRFALIMTALAAIIGHRMGRDPRFVSVIVPLWNRINRLARRFERLMAGFVAGKLRQPRQPGAPRPGGPHASVLPRGRFWLIRVLGYEACGCASQLEALLAEAAAVALLAEVPAAGRIIRPLVRMLAIGAVQRPVRPAKVAPRGGARVAAPPEAFIPPGRFLYRSAGHTWYEVSTPPFKNPAPPFKNPV
jgi:hypothetical protein